MTTDEPNEEQRPAPPRPHGRMRLFGVGVLCLVVGLVLSPATSAAGSALMSVFVTNDAAHPVPVAGTVTAGNLPIQGGRVLVTPSDRVPIHGSFECLTLGSTPVLFPTGVIITDIGVTSTGGTAHIGYDSTRPDIVALGPGSPDGTQLHLQSGLTSTDAAPLTAICPTSSVHIWWIGYGG